jgi:uncharacterized protein YxjI
MPFCGNCGNDVDPSKMRFCPRCGTPIEAEFATTPPPVPPKDPTTTNSPSPASKIPPQPPHTLPGGLFDPRRSAYVIHEKWWNWGSGDILDESGQKIGSMQRKILSLWRIIRFRELDGAPAGKIQTKILAVRPTYEIKDTNDRIIGIIEKKLLSFLRPKYFVLDENKNKILQIKGDYMRWDFNILDMHGNQVGTIKKMDRWHDWFLGGGIFDFSDKYALRIHTSHDRRLILGVVIAIDNISRD